jgi:hypothetical protein
MKKLLLVFIGIAFFGSVFSQAEVSNLKWDKTTHDFGIFKEEAGNQIAVFEFTNNGKEPVFITNVKASCGCTTPDWTKDPVKPGEKGYVKASYNPQNRPGKFNKSITVTTSETQPTTVLQISGEVTPKAQ